jgi:hypothetical protein
MPRMSTFTVVHDEAGLQALAPAWNVLEARARAAGRPDQLFASHRYVSAAWAHLRRADHRLYVLTLQRGGELQAVLPLALGAEKASGLPIRVLRPIGIWEGERPAVLSEAAPEAVWPALWRGLLAGRADWHVIDLREQDEDSWPVRQLPSVEGAVRVTRRADHAAPWQPMRGTWAAHDEARDAVVLGAQAVAAAALAARAPGLRTEVLSAAEHMAAGLARCWAIEATQAGAAGVYRLSDDAARRAFYGAFMPVLAARGEAELRLMHAEGPAGGSLGGQDVAALIRWRCGGVWIERHVAERAGWAEAAPGMQLLLGALADSWQGGAQSSELMLVPDGSGRVQALKGWYDGLRPTWRVSVWNLRSRMGLLALPALLRGR